MRDPQTEDGHLAIVLDDAAEQARRDQQGGRVGGPQEPAEFGGIEGRLGDCGHGPAVLAGTTRAAPSYARIPRPSRAVNDLRAAVGLTEASYRRRPASH